MPRDLQLAAAMEGRSFPAMQQGDLLPESASDARRSQLQLRDVGERDCAPSDHHAPDLSEGYLIQPRYNTFPPMVVVTRRKTQVEEQCDRQNGRYREVTFKRDIYQIVAEAIEETRRRGLTPALVDQRVKEFLIATDLPRRSKRIPPQPGRAFSGTEAERLQLIPNRAVSMAMLKAQGKGQKWTVNIEKIDTYTILSSEGGKGLKLGIKRKKLRIGTPLDPSPPYTLEDKPQPQVAASESERHGRPRLRRRFAAVKYYLDLYAEQCLQQQMRGHGIDRRRALHRRNQIFARRAGSALTQIERRPPRFTPRDRAPEQSEPFPKRQVRRLPSSGLRSELTRRVHGRRWPHAPSPSQRSRRSTPSNSPSNSPSTSPSSAGIANVPQPSSQPVPESPAATTQPVTITVPSAVSNSVVLEPSSSDVSGSGQDWRTTHAYSQGTPPHVRRNRERFDPSGSDLDDGFQDSQIASPPGSLMLDPRQDGASVSESARQQVEEHSLSDSPPTNSLLLLGHSLEEVASIAPDGAADTMPSTALTTQSGDLYGSAIDGDDFIRDRQGNDSEPDEQHLMMSGGLEGRRDRRAAAGLPLAALRSYGHYLQFNAIATMTIQPQSSSSRIPRIAGVNWQEWAANLSAPPTAHDGTVLLPTAEREGESSASSGQTEGSWEDTSPD